MARPVEAMVPLGARSRALLLGTLLVGASAILLGGDVVGFSAGIDEEAEAANGGTTTLVEGGCSCHNTAYTGNVVAVLEGAPPFYVAPSTQELVEGPFNLTIRIVGGPEASESGAQGGFNLQVSDGTLGVPEGADDVSVTEAGEATHTFNGNRQREWNVTWTPPAEAGPDVIFTLTVNSVNGNGAPETGDEWGRATVVSMGETRLGAAPAGEGESRVHEIVSLGVNFYAYWVGVVSFIVLFVVLAATFFLLRYGESRHFTDWKDRPAKKQGEGPKSPMGTFVVLGIVLVVFLVAVVQIVRLV